MPEVSEFSKEKRVDYSGVEFWVRYLACWLFCNKQDTELVNLHDETMEILGLQTEPGECVIYDWRLELERCDLVIMINDDGDRRVLTCPDIIKSLANEMGIEIPDYLLQEQYDREMRFSKTKQWDA